jgi:hypothetical protein
MITTALSALFALAALTAIVVIAATIRQHGEVALAARGAWLACPETRTVTYRISEVQVLRGPAQVLKLPVRQMARNFSQPERRAA